jgi:hypothetical protein
MVGASELFSPPLSVNQSSKIWCAITNVSDKPRTVHIDVVDTLGLVVGTGGCIVLPGRTCGTVGHIADQTERFHCRFEFDGSKSAMRASIHTTEEHLEAR